jgi:undecaprenol kinase
MKNKEDNGYTRFFNSFRYATHGIIILVRSEQNFVIMIVLGMCAMTVALYFYHMIWFSLITLTTMLVLISEIFNTVVERMCNLIEPRICNDVKKIKDITAAASFLASVLSLVIGIAFVLWILEVE